MDIIILRLLAKKLSDKSSDLWFPEGAIERAVRDAKKEVYEELSDMINELVSMHQDQLIEEYNDTFL